MPPTLATISAIGLIVLLGGGLALFALTRIVLGGADMQDRLQAYAAIPEYQSRRSRSRRQNLINRVRLRLNSMLTTFGSEKLALQLMSANLPITMTEFTLIRLGAMLAGFLLGWLVAQSIVSGIVLGIVANLIPTIYLRRRISQRRIKFEKQLIDVLVLITGAVRAGFSLLQALEVVVKEMKPPASEEFKRVINEVGLGLSLTQALDNLVNRMENNDLELLVTAIDIQYQVGGNLATMLEAVTKTLRERIRLFSEVRVLTTQQRYTSYLISLLPFFVGALLFFMNPSYMMRLFDPNIICMPIGALTGIILGHFIIRRIARIEV